MSNSLRALSDEDLRPVSESIENMNKTKEQLQLLENSKKAIDHIINPYETYNQCVIFNKAKKFVDILSTYKKEEKEALSMQDKISNAKIDLKKSQTELEQVDARLEGAKYKEEELNKKEIFHQKKELETMEYEMKELENNLKEKNELLEKKKEEIRRKETELKKNRETYDIQIEEFTKIEENSRQIAEEIACDEVVFQIDEIKENINKKYIYEGFIQEIKRYTNKIEDGKKAIEKKEEALKEYDKILEQLDNIKATKAKQDSDVTKNRLVLNEAKEIFIEQMYEWEKKNILLKIKPEGKVKISDKIENYGEKTSFDDVLVNVRKPYEEIKGELLSEKIKLENQKKEYEEEINKKKEEKSEWENRKEPEPERKNAIIKNREKLKKLGIPFIPFYNAIDFRKEVEEETKGKIESALLSMGILDSLILSKEDIKKVKQIDTGFVDSYLEANPKEFRMDLSHLVNITIPEGINISIDTVGEILRSILIDDETSQTYLDEKGNYKIGILKGQTQKEEAKFIGVEAKRKYQLSKIAQIEEEINTLKKEKEEIGLKIEKQENKIINLEEEVNNFPKKEDMEKNYNELKKSIYILNAIKSQIEEKEKELTIKFNELKKAKEEMQIVIAKLPFIETLESYTQKLESANELKEEIFKLKGIQGEIVNSNQKIDILIENSEDAKFDMDNLLYDSNQFEKQKKIYIEKITRLKELMQSDDILDLQKQMEECLKLKRELPILRDVLIKTSSRLETEIENNKEKLTFVTQRVELLRKKTKIADEIFVQELKLNYVIDEYQDIIKAAQKIVSQYASFEKSTKSLSDYLDSLSIKYRENIEYLIDYSMSIEEVFVQEEIVETNEELRQLYKTRIRRDIFCFVKGRKVNLITLAKEVEDTIKETRMLIEDEDRKLFEEILTNTVGRKIRERIYHAKQWVKTMNDLMESLNTSSGLSFSLNWKSKVATDETEVDTKELVDILNSDSKLLRQDEISKVAMHFRTKFAKAEEKLKQKENVMPFHTIMKDVLDYRNWFEFQFMHKKTGETKKELTNNAFYKLSGGEKAMAMYIPLFAAVYARYESGRADAPRIISLDEAFAGVDDNNIRDMFRVLTELKLEYIINSQVLWGEYDTIPSLAICELVSNPGSKVVSVIRYYWNGQKRELIV